MAQMTITALDGLISDLADLAALPEDEIYGILSAEADVAVRAEREEIKRQWSGPHSMGVSAKSIKKDRKLRALGEGRIYHYINVYPQGTRKRGRKRIRNAEIAFINEYGVPGRGIAARPAISISIEKAKEEIFAAGEKAYDAYLDSKNL